ncbi:MAG TPA: ferrous iron transport protein B [Candidatus Hydrogenedentes bacterium]|jgi:ferrous iron transport protein B|nr:ferrous iron transport protein B [Candidatus Hydrogenedentota bacterium]HOD94173.1 ferrous iron transport protein B [Candidatus Hydrogenedentota bacterium]HOR49580.1 ferrous iron transport protein B [Candidatus Hydrogenedentota bacterium]HPK23553.1 ferrous iron transport protein B [Candidatus Hydrogenedentota bacterium]HPX85115.1 ferrous iron transport protein B [Candidatus Hydrogenedentota bacterium]
MSPGKIVIAGNPNAGKTCLFNALTGSAQQVSNYPGVTVEFKSSVMRWQGHRVTVVDLPGTYSLTAYSQEELVARNYILDEHPAVIVNVVDASNLERNLYLSIQLMEIGIPMVIALNMVDTAERRGYKIDAETLSRLLGVPVIPTIACRGKGIDEIAAASMAILLDKEQARPAPLSYGHGVDDEVLALTEEIRKIPALNTHLSPAWLAVKVLEKDERAVEEIKKRAPEETAELFLKIEDAVRRIERHFNADASTLVAEHRYGIASGLVKRCVTFNAKARRDITEQLDLIICNRIIGPIILLLVVAALFFWVFKVSDEWKWIPWFGGFQSPTHFMESLFLSLAALIAPLKNSMPMLHSLLNDGIIGGVGGVMSFVPLIFFMFLFVAALEDSGYIARVAFILDRPLRIFGLQGKSILAFIVAGGLGAGGCAVPGIMSTRTMREDRDRLVTMLVTPFMNCGAKMPVYAMLIAAFFPNNRTLVMMILWALSWLTALAAAWILRRTLVRGEQMPFVMELPPYHMPVLRGVLRHTWERTWMYMKKAGTVILAINLVLWALMYFPHPAEETNPEEKLAYSYAGRAGKALEPISRAAGFDWRTNIALIGGFAAKEVVLGVLGTAYSLENTDEENYLSLSEQLAKRSDWNPVRAFALMVFVMLYAPCLVTIAVIRRESGSWKWALFSTVYSTAFAFILAIAFYRIGSLLI